MVEFATFTREEYEHLKRIVDRAERMLKEQGKRLDRLSLEMDIQATHYHIPLRLAELADADDFNFAHDVYGIMYHMNRRTGRLEHCFVPRFAVPEGRKQERQAKNG